MDAQRPGCPIEYYNIPVPKDHRYNPGKKDDLEMPFQRARYDQRTGYSPNNPRQQVRKKNYLYSIQHVSKIFLYLLTHC